MLGVNRTERLYALVEELRARAPRTVRAVDLARRFEISVRTMERDLLALQKAGVPIWSRPGPSGGYGLHVDTTLPLPNLTRPKRSPSRPPWPPPAPCPSPTPDARRSGSWPASWPRRPRTLPPSSPVECAWPRVRCTQMRFDKVFAAAPRARGVGRSGVAAGVRSGRSGRVGPRRNARVLALGDGPLPDLAVARQRAVQRLDALGVELAARLVLKVSQRRVDGPRSAVGAG